MVVDHPFADDHFTGPKREKLKHAPRFCGERLRGKAQGAFRARMVDLEAVFTEARGLAPAILLRVFRRFPGRRIVRAPMVCHGVLR